MSTFTASASTIAFVKSASSSSWEKGKAYQGQYGGFGGSREGVFIFNTLRDVDWSEQTISQITITLKFAKAGDEKKKDVHFYRGTSNSISNITGSTMRGSSLGTVNTVDKAHGATRTLTLNSSTNASVFSSFIDFLQNGTTKSIVIYNGETISASSGWTANYACVTSASITVTYELSGSSGTLSAESVDLGGTIICTITPIEESGHVVTHKARWVFGSQDPILVDADDTANPPTVGLEVPTSADWLGEFTEANTTELPAECQLITYVDGSERGVKSIPFTVAVPPSYNPTFSYTITPTDSMGTYYQHLNKATITITNAAAVGTGATITSYSIVGSEGVSFSSSSVNTYTTPKFEVADVVLTDRHTYTLSVTDNRGATTTQTVQIIVTKVDHPTISLFSAKRYSSKLEEGQTVYYETPTGDHVWISCDIEIDSAGGNNVMTPYIMYGPAGATLENRVNLLAGAAHLIITENRSLISGTIPLNSAYEFELHVADKYYNDFAHDRVDKSIVPFHIAGSGYGVGLGKYSDGTSTIPKIQTGWDIYAEQPIHANAGIWGQDGNRVDYHININETITTLDTQNFECYDTDQGGNGIYPTVIRDGNIVQLNGVLKPKRTLTSDSSLTYTYTMFTLPSAYRPNSVIVAVMQGSGQRVWEMQVGTDGVVSTSRLRDSSGYTNYSNTTWLPFHLTWITSAAIS